MTAVTPPAVKCRTTDPSPYEAVADQKRYRQADATFGPCPHGYCGTLCVNSGKVGRNGRSAAIGATLCWLTCPQLNNFIARLERHGLIAALSARLAVDETLRGAHIASHVPYESLAMRTLEEPQRRFFREHFIEPIDPHKRKFGNAAVGHEGDLKCMHALVAQTLCGASNPLGNLCLHYVLALQRDVADLLQKGSSEYADIPEQTSVAGQLSQPPNPAVCAMVDRVSGLLDFLDEKGLVAVQNPPQDAEGKIAAADCCAAAEFIIVACEGHAPRTRKKHRKN